MSFLMVSTSIWMSTNIGQALGRTGNQLENLFDWEKKKTNLLVAGSSSQTHIRTSNQRNDSFWFASRQPGTTGRSKVRRTYR